MSRLRTQYDEEIVKAMTEKFGYKNVMEVPKTWRRLPDRRQLFVKLRNQLLTLNFVKEWELVVKPLFVEKECMNLQIV